MRSGGLQADADRLPARRLQLDDAARVGLGLEHLFVVDFYFVRLARLEPYDEHGFGILPQLDREAAGGLAEAHHRLRQVERAGRRRLQAAIREELHPALKAPNHEASSSQLE